MAGRGLLRLEGRARREGALAPCKELVAVPLAASAVEFQVGKLSVLTLRFADIVLPIDRLIITATADFASCAGVLDSTHFDPAAPTPPLPGSLACGTRPARRKDVQRG